MIVCIGEILADMIGHRKEHTVEYHCHAGGAPFNVACCIARLGDPVHFYGRVGKDEVGRFILEEAAKEKDLHSHITVDDRHNTTLAFVTLGDQGERSFSFARKESADYAFDPADEIPELAGADIVHIGSLILSEASSRAFAKNVCRRAKHMGKKISFDVNYREDVFSSREEAIQTYRPWLEWADIVKLSEEEVALFFESENELKIFSQDKKVFVTLGQQGAMLWEKGNCTFCASIAVQPVDTTGAGDAFFAGALFQIDSGVTDARQILQFANICGALSTQAYGALGGLPQKEAVLERMDPHSKVK